MNQETILKCKQFLAAQRGELLTITALLVVSIVAFGQFNSRILFLDDWSFIVERFAFGTLSPFDLTDRRPFLMAFHSVLAAIFGLQFQYYYFFNFIILFLSALLVYSILKRIFPTQAWIASLVALVYLIYPVDTTRTWMNTTSNRFWWLVSLGAIWLLLEFVVSGKAWTVVLAIIGAAISLGAYEGQFGILLLAGILIAVFANQSPLRRRITVLLAVAGTGVSFALWRTLLQPRFFHVRDTYVETLQFNPVVLAERYLHGFYIFSIGWLDPIQTQLQLLGVNLLPWLLFYIVTCCAVILWMSARRNARNEIKSKLETHNKTQEAKIYLTMLLVGFAFWVAGYIPIIFLYSPSVSLVASRVNFFSVPGAALILVATIALLATFVTRSTFTQRSVVVAIILPFLVAGIFEQFQVNWENQVKWETQKQIWRGIFTTISNLRDQSTIVIIIPGYEHLRPFESYPFLASWETASGARVLYNNQTISGNYYYKDIPSAELLFTPNGFRPIPTNKPIPYKRLVFVLYDPASESVTLVDDLQKTLALPFKANNYNPGENIISAKPSTGKFRWLVE